jgi:hypothetical protein
MEKQDQALKRLLKKLSALRATLKSEERIILDELITDTAVEVEAHRMTVSDKDSRVTPRMTVSSDEVIAHATPISPRATPRMTPRKTVDEDEVSAHRMTVSDKDSRVTPRMTVSDDEAIAHRMTVSDKDSRVTPRMTVSDDEAIAHRMTVSEPDARVTPRKTVSEDEVVAHRMTVSRKIVFDETKEEYRFLP